MTTHPTPWTYDSDNYLRDANGETFWLSVEDGSLQRVVAAVNAHEALVAVADFASEGPCYCHHEMTQHKPCLVCRATAALRLAEGK